MCKKATAKKSNDQAYSHLRDLLILLILSVALYVVTAVTLTKAAALDLAYVTNYLGCAAFLLGSMAYIVVPFVQAYKKALPQAGYRINFHTKLLAHSGEYAQNSDNTN